MTQPPTDPAAISYIPIVIGIVSFVGGLFSAYLIELAKAKLSVATKRQTDFAEQQRQALMDFFDSAAEIVIDKLATNIFGLDVDGERSLEKYGNAVETLFTRHATNWFRLRLFISKDSDVIKRAGEVSTDVFQIQDLFDIHFGRYKDATLQLNERKKVHTANIDTLLTDWSEASDEYIVAIKAQRHKLGHTFESFCVVLSKHLMESGKYPLPKLDIAPPTTPQNI